jgi:hypothetical protein
MPQSTPSSDGSSAPSEIREVFLSVVEESLQAQLAAVRRLRAREPDASQEAKPRGRRKTGRPHIDLAFNILTAAGSPLHVSAILERIEAAFGVKIDSESLVSALSKRVARKDRFTRTARNTFALLP